MTKIALDIFLTSYGPFRGRKRTGQDGDGLQVLVCTLAKDEGGRGIISRRVLDGVCLASLDGPGEFVDLEGRSSDNEGSASEESLDEKHLD